MPEALTVLSVDRASLLRASPSGVLPASLGPARAASTWCGTPTTQDQAPNAVAGNAIHWLYVVPLDGGDRISTEASAMQTDAELIDSWWRGQDPTRAPRNDLTPLTCGMQLDLSDVRLTASGSQLDDDVRFDRIVAGIEAAGFRSPFVKYIVYFDGPVSDTNLCGQGGSDPAGFGVAVVYVRSCSGIAPSLVAAHELLHTLGAVPTPRRTTARLRTTGTSATRRATSCTRSRARSRFRA